jgi:hypothetical protein
MAGVQVKVEDEGSYDCAICFMSVRGSTDALRCTRCSSNPFHGACLVHAGFPDSCPQCSGNTLVAGVRAPVPRDAMQTDLTSDMQSDLGLSVADTDAGDVNDIAASEDVTQNPKKKKKGGGGEEGASTNIAKSKDKAEASDEKVAIPVNI